MIKRSKRQQRT